VDQIISGTVINIFSVGITSFISARFLSEFPQLNNPGTFKAEPIPLLSGIPFIGPIFFDNNFFVYAMYVLLIVVQVALFYTRWGLRTRAVGENPKAADTLGINVFRTRYNAVLLSGALAGFAGRPLRRRDDRRSRLHRARGDDLWQLDAARRVRRSADLRLR
jgi:simple sugar transport system permease protein